MEFKDRKLEEKYSEFQLEYKRKPLAKVMIFIGFFIGVMQVVVSIMDGNLIDLFLSLGFLTENVFMLLIFLYRPKYIRWAFMLVTYMLVLQYIKNDDGKDQFHYQLKALVLFSSQFIIISTGEFLDALFSIIGIFSIYIAYYIKYQENYSYSVIISFFVVGILLLGSFYKNSLAERSQFQLTVIEDQWDQIFFGTIKQPSIIFSFDLIKQSFILKKSINFPYTCNSTDELKEFLRKTSLCNSKSSLEAFIYKQLNSLNLADNKQLSQQLRINYKKVTYEINYSIFPGASSIIFIEIPQTSINIAHKKLEKLYQYKYFSLIKLLEIKIKDMFLAKTNDFRDLIKILVYRQSLEKLGKEKKKFNIVYLLKKLKFIYANKIFQFYCPLTFVVSNKNTLMVLLIDIFESTISSHIQVTIEQFKNENYLQVKVIGEYTERSILNLKKRIQFLEKNVEEIQADVKGVNFKIATTTIETSKSRLQYYEKNQ